MTEVCLENASAVSFEDQMYEIAGKAEGAEKKGDVIKLSLQLSKIYKRGLQENPHAEKRLTDIYTSIRQELGKELTHLLFERLRGN